MVARGVRRAGSALPGTMRIFLQFSHCTLRPAKLLAAVISWPQAQENWMVMVSPARFAKVLL
jgi:hypothetical protein